MQASTADSLDSSGGSARARMLAGAPVTQRRLLVAGTVTALLEGGEGPPLILLHGGIESGGVYWAPILSELAGGHRLIVPDAPGLGESEPVERLDPTTFARWLDELVELTCAQAPALVAHSLFGNYVARLPADRGERLRRLVIYAAPGIGAYRMPLGLRIVAIRFALRPTPRNEARFERFALLDRERTRNRDRDWFDAFSAYSLERARVAHVKRTMSQLIRIGTTRVPDAELARIRPPVGVVWGTGDRMTPLGTAVDTARRLRWPVRVIEDAAHVPHIEQPKSFLSCVDDLIREPATRSRPRTEEAVR
jgi:pimeloyl-ACP methyl ester carboxylesterase